MPEAKSAVLDAPKRDREAIVSELDSARESLSTLHIRVDADRDKVRKANDRLAKAIERWRQDNPGEQFDLDRLDELDPSVQPYKCDPALGQEFHKAHYTVKRLQDELVAFDATR